MTADVINRRLGGLGEAHPAVFSGRMGMINGSQTLAQIMEIAGPGLVELRYHVFQPLRNLRASRKLFRCVIAPFESFLHGTA
jgi:hypothetical protein